MERCEVCDGECRRGVADWHYECPDCGTEHSTLRPRINAGVAAIIPEEDSRVAGLASIRRDGYQRILGELDRLRGRRHGALLEVGSAYGWFLTAARNHFERAVGIEPDDAVRTCPDTPGVEVRTGYFPRALGPEERFDVVVFNDVFEHIPDARAVTEAVHGALRPGGLSVVNLPVKEGGLYRVSKLLYRLGIRAPFDRMWQRHFPSPHLYYFSSRGLTKMFAAADLVCDSVIAMPTLRVRGLWPRIRHAEPNLSFAVFAYLSALLVVPFVALVPADVRCFFFRARDGR